MGWLGHLKCIAPLPPWKRPFVPELGKMRQKSLFWNPGLSCRRLEQRFVPYHWPWTHPGGPWFHAPFYLSQWLNGRESFQAGAWLKPIVAQYSFQYPVLTSTLKRVPGPRLPHRPWTIWWQTRSQVEGFSYQRCLSIKTLWRILFSRFIFN